MDELCNQVRSYQEPVSLNFPIKGISSQSYTDIFKLKLVKGISFTP